MVYRKREMLKKFQHNIDIVKVWGFDYGLWHGQYNIRYHACPKPISYRRAVEDAEKDFLTIGAIAVKG